jgi:soluble lytic murein transglycosylase
MIFIIPILAVAFIGFILLNQTQKTELDPEQVKKVAPSIVSKIAKVAGYIIKYNNENDIQDPILIASMIVVESSGNPNAIRQEPKINDASYGLMQILYRTAKSVGFTGIGKDLFDPETNIKYGCKYVKICLNKENRDLFNTCRAYNGGTGWRNSSATAKAMTLNHANKVMSVYNYLKVYSKDIFKP